MTSASRYCSRPEPTERLLSYVGRVLFSYAMWLVVPVVLLAIVVAWTYPVPLSWALVGAVVWYVAALLLAPAVAVAAALVWVVVRARGGSGRSVTLAALAIVSSTLATLVVVADIAGGTPFRPEHVLQALVVIGIGAAFGLLMPLPGRAALDPRP